MVKKSMWMSLLGLFSLTILTACQPTSFGSSKPVSARSLAEDYERSSAAVRMKYDGKEIIVRGYASVAPTMPRPGDDQGSVLMEEKETSSARRVACWFSKDQAAAFSQVKGGRYITVKGVFNGEAGAELRFCKLVKIDSESE
jgi:tRNA_anti-like